MDYKSIVVENAWFGLNVDYGLLHVQLGTPVATGIILLIVGVSLNKLLFQPVLRTLDNRQAIISESQNTTSHTQERIQTLSADYEKQLQAARAQINEAHQKARTDAQSKRDAQVGAAKEKANQYLEQERSNLSASIKETQEALTQSSEALVQLTTQKILGNA